MRRITIIGAGLFGLACAHACARRGLAVRVIEARRIGAGASGGQVGALAPHDPAQWNDKKQIQLEALVAAGDYWAEVRAIGGVDSGWARLGRFSSPHGDVAARLAGATRHWPAGFSMQLRRAEHPLLAGGDHLFDTLTARISPRGAGAALAAAVRAQGGVIEEGAGPRHPDRIDIDGPCIWATGAEGLEMLSVDLGRPVGRAIKGQSASFRLSLPQAPQLFLEGLHVVPHADGTVAIGSTAERDFADPAATDAQLEALIERARTLCPPLAAAPLAERWAGLRPRAQSRAPLLGPWPGRDGHWVANGGFKIGLAMAPWAGEALADWLLDGHCRVPEGWRLTG